MNAQTILANEPTQSLGNTFITNFPSDAARLIESMESSQASDIFTYYPINIVAPVLERMLPGFTENLLLKLSPEKAAELLKYIDARVSTAILSRLRQQDCERFLSLMPSGVAKELRSLLEYPEETAGRLMQTQVLAFNGQIKIGDAIEQIKKLNVQSIEHLYLLNENMQLSAQLDTHRLVLADKNDTLDSISTPIKVVAQALDPQEDFLEQFEKHQLQAIPVIDIDQHLLGVLQAHELIGNVREDMASSMQTMVGASKDERALSSSFFAVKKRLPWLQINLVTAFLAAGVVGMFESTIAKYTALAVLLPIAAGQSGNAGAQALAVTMRGLTLREISIQQWLRVLIKELGAGLMNGIGIALTCSAGVYIWSQSIGLALIMALSMIISMTIAGVAGAIVPILLKRFGLDPAQSSSIVLTTITDIAGFMSFLGIATLLAGMLSTS